MRLYQQEQKTWDDTVYSAFLTDNTLVLRERAPTSKRGFIIWRWRRDFSLPFNHSHYEAWDKQMVEGWKLEYGVMPPFEPSFVLSKVN